MKTATISSSEHQNAEPPSTSTVLSKLPKFTHLLVVLGGQAGIEAAAENDSQLNLDSGNISELFDWPSGLVRVAIIEEDQGMQIAVSGMEDVPDG